MATQIAGPVRLPDGTNPAHGQVIFRPRRAIVGAAIVTASPVVAQIAGGAITVTLEGEASGTPYGVSVEHWSDAAGFGQLVTTGLPDVVVTGEAGPFAIEDLAAVQIPGNATNSATFKRGDTISIGGQWLDDNGRPLDLTSLTLTSAMLGPDGVIRPLPLTVSDAPAGLIEIALAASASAVLPLGRHQIDVKITNGARVSRTQTGFINIIEEITP